ncbi:flavin reductase family protein [Alicyclobacillus acidocaldarius]|uniref:Flavin reductase domain protein FMN-binding protein n=1 Tax=Alicyclobacillus acidocaldarius (strain Tc-4-1) TaxID=1048834 RepID=F8IE77_ALIAT|nr:flavin reductase family protein [Alicyclobacillus acidocaldarius]AEJ43919.1 flavin reductase domain protein FMN-binding protein [Alicyclobacillus acidocaldarius subsp. acidocaldarius Tc-4-1]
MAIDEYAFRKALARFASGVTVITAATEGEMGGITVSAFCSLSLLPPLVLACIDERASILPLLRRSGAFAVNILSDDQSGLSNQFASKMSDKFQGVSYDVGPLGQPLLAGAQAYLVCTLVHEWKGGDHRVVVGQVEAASADESRTPLLYYASQYGSFQPLS